MRVIPPKKRMAQKDHTPVTCNKKKSFISKKIKNNKYIVNFCEKKKDVLKIYI